MINLVRYGFLDFTEASIALSLLALAAATAALFAFNLRLFVDAVTSCGPSSRQPARRLVRFGGRDGENLRKPLVHRGRKRIEIALE